MAQSITLGNISVDENEENVTAIRNHIADLKALMGENLTEEIGKTISALINKSYDAGYSTGGADARYEG
ncbi:MAG: hypothetical protein H9W81_07705 [Enterococcus sp.]|nr:hypothetical protein [Enterococcus sp.]